MRILICSNIYPPNIIGGAELIAHYQGVHLVRAGHDVQVFAGNQQPQKGRRHEINSDRYDGLTVHRVNLVGEDYQPTFVNFSHPEVERHFSRLLAEFQPEVVHCHNIIGLSVSILTIAKEFGAKVVLTVHDHWGFCFKNTIMKRDGEACSDYSQCHECQEIIDDGAQRRIPMRMRQDYMALAMNSVDAFISPSQYLADTYIVAGVPPAKMNVVWNGIDVDKFSAIEHIHSNEVLRLSFFGYFGRHKGIHTLLGALPLLKRRERVRVNLIGEGDQRGAYEQQLSENGCSNLVKFWGRLDNAEVTKAYAETDVLVLPSIWRENQPVSITEAMACGIPVIASNMGGMPELVKDGVNGLIFDAGDVASLAKKIDRLIDDPALVAAFGANGKTRISDSSFIKQVEKLHAIYLHDIEDRKLDSRHSRPVVVCVGQRVHELCAKAMDQLAHYHAGVEPLLVMEEWLTATQLRQACLVWVVDGDTSLVTVMKFARMGLPLLVPSNNRAMSDVCRKHSIGLYYEDSDEASACLAYLLSNTSERNSLASNAQRLRDVRTA